MISLYEQFKSMLNEELLCHTLNPDRAAEHIQTDLYLIHKEGFAEGDVRIDIHHGNIIVDLVNMGYTRDRVEHILTSVYATGFYIAQFFLSTPHITDRLFVNDEEFLSKFESIPEKIMRFRLVCVPKWDNATVVPEPPIYHVTRTDCLEQVLREGLCPKCSKKKKEFHPPCVYLCLTMDSTKRMIRQMSTLDFVNGRKPCLGYAILEVDLSKTQTSNFRGEEDGVILYKDRHSEGIFTYDNIPPKCLSLVEIVETLRP